MAEELYPYSKNFYSNLCWNCVTESGRSIGSRSHQAEIRPSLDEEYSATKKAQEKWFCISNIGNNSLKKGFSQVTYIL